MRAGLAATLAGIVVVGCGTSPPYQGPPRPSGEITVFAAASLTDAFKAMGNSFQQSQSGVKVKFNFAGTPTLVTQIEQGAHADVFAAADTTNMDRLKAGGSTRDESRVFAHNQLEIVVAPGNPKKIAGLSDLAQQSVIYITEAPSVPAGKYSLQTLAKAGVTVKPRSLEADVKSVLSKIEFGEADAGIVYTTDVKAAGDKVTGVPIPDQYNVVATYPIVAVKGTGNISAARAFIDYVLSSAGQSVLESFGFQHA